MKTSYIDAKPNIGQSSLLERLHEAFFIKHLPIFVYSGSPGTGKTWIIRLFFEMHNISPDEFITCAYSGKAANVLAMNGLPARTIHSLIYDLVVETRTDPITGEVKNVPTFVKKTSLPGNYKFIVVDELSMVPDNIMEDLLSFGVPIIGMGDINQLPPVFGYGSYIEKPDFVLTEIMRQAWDSPIIKMSQYVLHDRPLAYGSYGNNCNVLTRINIGKNLFGYDCILCNRNATRQLVNMIFRADLLKFVKFGEIRPSLCIGDKIVCKQNCWDLNLDGLYLTNGTLGTVDYIDEEHTDKHKITIDFKPDYSDRQCFDNIPVSRKYLEDADKVKTFGKSTIDFDYAYALTVHSAQGSQFNRILYIEDGFSGDRDIKRKLKYTAITRAVESIDIVDANCFYTYQPYNVK